MSTDVFSVIADPTRRRILQALHSGPRPVNDVVAELGVSQPTVSKHLRVLREAELVTMRAQGQKRYYALRAEPLEPITRWIADLRRDPQAAQEQAVQEIESPQDVEVAHEAGTPGEAPAPEPIPGASAEHVPEAPEQSGDTTTRSPEEAAGRPTGRRRRSGVVFHPLTPARAVEASAVEDAAPEEAPAAGAPAAGAPAIGTAATPASEPVPDSDAEVRPTPSPGPAPTPPESLDPHVRREPEGPRASTETKPGGILASLFGRKRGR